MPPSAGRNTVTSEKLKRLAESFDEPSPISVLLVEDGRTVRLKLRQYIEQLRRVELVEAETLAAAHALLEKGEHKFFCAILDLTLPDASGTEIVDLVRSYGIPVVVQSASASPKIRSAMHERRVIDYIIKTNPTALEDVAYLVGRLRQNSGMTVMVVDDSATVRLYLSSLLQQYQFQVLLAQDGIEALELLAQHPDTALIITDYQMPRMTGLELIQQIRQDQRREDLAIIGLSDSSSAELSPAMLKAGANDYLNKKFQPEEFYCRVVQNINMVWLVRQLRETANRDYLTRLHNRRHLFELGETLHSEALRGQAGIALAMIDVDHFKQCNDRYGHAIGDEVLRQVADTLRGHVSSGDLVGRYGGEEFVWVMRTERQPDLQARMEALRAAVEGTRLKAGNRRIGVTVSIGFTTRLSSSLSNMIALADRALYRAKQTGRNRVAGELSAPEVDPA